MAGRQFCEDCDAYRTEQDFLRIELHHRLMNTFAALSALLRRDLNQPDACLREAIVRSARMIEAHAGLHRCLLIGRSEHPVELGDYVVELCERLTEAVLEPLGVRCEVVIDSGPVCADQCERLGLVLCELVINASKHAFDRADNGVVFVALARHPSGWRCTVSDNGRGWTAREAPFGLGNRIIDELVRRLQGRMDLRSSPSGVAAVLLFPSESPARSSQPKQHHG